MSFDIGELATKVQARLVAEGNCLVFTGARGASGYGIIRAGRELRYAHRVICEVHHGPADPNEEVLHSCDNRPCCKPEHLRWGSRAQNMREAYERDRNRVVHHVGEQHARHKLTEPQVREMRERRGAGEGLGAIAADYGIHLSTVHQICSRKTWRHVA
jgi:hypothetical protein